MTLAEHLEELRTRVIHIVIAIIVILVICMTFDLRSTEYDGLVILYPYPDPVHNISASIMRYMQITLIPDNVTLVQTAPGQAFFSQIYVSVLIGIMGAMPIIVKEITGFVSPAMSSYTNMKLIRISVPAIILFVSGVIFSYIAVVPFTLQFLYQFGEAIDVLPLFNITDFISFVLQFLLAFGISFELPVIMYGISITEAVSSKFWRDNIRYAFVILVVFGAIITPDGSGVTMWFVAGPMIGLYLIGMVAVERRAQRRAAGIPKT